MILADTNVFSALMRTPREAVVVRWLDSQPHASVWISSISILEIRFGLEIMSSGRKRSALTAAFEHLVTNILDSRIALFDAAAAEEAAKVMAVRRARGRPGEQRDTMIAGIALANRATIATRNQRHFDDLQCQVVDPWSF
jgi:predicted nucleic acid-binding protein